MKRRAVVRSRYVRHKQHIPWYVHDIVGMFLITVTLLFLCAIVSHNPYDPSWFYVTSDAHVITNWCGAFGAELSALLLYLVGSSALFGVFGIGMLAYECIFYKSYSKNFDRIIACFIAMNVSASWCFMFSIDFLGASCAGGAVGMYLYQLLYKLFDSVGAFLCIHSLLIVCFLLITRLSVIRLVYYVIKHMNRYSYKAFLYACTRLPKMYFFMHQASRACFRVSCWITFHMRQFIVGVSEYEDAYDYDEHTQKEFDVTLYDGDQWSFHETYEDQARVVAEPLSYDIQKNAAPAEVLASETASLEDKELYSVPDLSLFVSSLQEKNDQKYLREVEIQAGVLEEKLARFGVKGSVTSIKRGPVVTLFEYQPDIDSKISKIISLEHDLALALQAISIRIIAPIPGKAVIGFEVANKHIKDVLFAMIIKSSAYTESKAVLPLILGQDTSGEAVVVDLAAMPHLLVAGSTGSGKSVGLNGMLIGLLCAHAPQALKLILIDPKRLEFAAYADIAHLIFPIVTDPRKALQALQWVVKEMEDRYSLMALAGCRNSIDYNKNTAHEPMPFIVVIIDELADLMMTAGRDIEALITRIAQMARAAGIHVIVATQRPSVDVITGLIKANFPSRISFRVASKIDSRTILDAGGADSLVGRGDMLFLDSRTSFIKRVHGAYVSDTEIEHVVAHIKSQATVVYKDIMEELPVHGLQHDEEDAIYCEIVYFLQTIDEVSISLLQRRFRIGYNRAARIIEMLEAQGRVMPCEQGKIRKVIK